MYLCSAILGKDIVEEYLGGQQRKKVMQIFVQK